MVVTYQNKLKPCEISPTAGKWSFQLIAGGHIFHTSRPLYDTQEEAHNAAFLHSRQLAKRA